MKYAARARHPRYFANEKVEGGSRGSSCPPGAVHLNNCFKPNKAINVRLCACVRSCDVKLVAELQSVDRSAAKSCNPSI